MTFTQQDSGVDVTDGRDPLVLAQTLAAAALMEYAGTATRDLSRQASLITAAASLSMAQDVRAIRQHLTGASE